MKVLILLLITLFNFSYCICNYNISVLFFVSLFIIEFFSIIILRNIQVEFNKKKILICTLLSTVILFLFPNNLLFGYDNKKITIVNDNINISLYMDDVKQIISNQKDTLETDYQKLNKLTACYYNNEDIFSFNTEKKHKIKLNLEKKDAPQTIFIDNKEINIPQKEYYEDSFIEKLDHFYYSIDLDNLSDFNLFLTILSFVYLIIMLYFIKDDSKKILFISLILFEFSGVLNFNVFNKILVFGLSYFINIRKNININKLLIIPSIIVTFCLGGNIFIDNFNFSKILFFLFLCYLVFHFLNISVYYLNKIKINKNNIYKKHKYILFCIIFFIMIIYKIIIGECFIHPDGLMQLNQIDGSTPLNTWHPFLHTLFIKVLNFHNIDGFVYFRIVLVSIVVVWILNYWYKKGLNIKFYYIIGILFALFPVNILYLMTLTKDVDFSIFLVIITHLICIFVFERKLSKPQIIIYYISLMAILYFRHNGIIAFIGLSILSFFILRYNYKKRIILSSIVLAFIILFRIFMFNVFNVEDKKYNFSLATMAHGLNYLYIENELGKSDYDYLQSIMEDRNWMSGYHKYNVDLLIHYNSGNFLQKDIDYIKFSATYLKNAFKHPIYLIKDRFYGTDILWNVFGSDYIENYKYQLIYDEYGNDWSANLNIKLNDNKITNVLHNIILFIGSNSILDALFFRGGIYFAISIFLIFYIICYKEKKLLFIFLPMLLNNISLFLAMHHQSYRYVLYMPFICFILFIASIFYKKR